MKTAISLPDALFAEADALAKRLGKSRSELYRDAVAEYIARRDPDSATAAMNRVIDVVGEQPDPFVSAVARRVLRRSEW
jgi:metal-responsive CopG/Arc/MetJ family transcriptional regulator